MRYLWFILLIFALASPVLASSGGKKSKKGASNRIKAEWTLKNDVIPEPKAQDQIAPGRLVDIPVVVVPISIDGRLINYGFVSIRVVLVKNVDAWKLRAKSHFMRDAIIRVSHEHAFGKAGERSLLDEERTIELVKAAIQPWIADNQLDHIELSSVDMLNG